MKVAVTGGAGFIGANLCREFSQSAAVDRIVVLDDLSTGVNENLTDVPGTELVIGSILNSPLLEEVFEGCSAVVHLAARPSVPRSLADPVATHQANATGTVLVLEAAKRRAVRQVVIASSSSVYGANPTLPKSEDLVPAPISPYAASKLAAEAYAASYARAFGLRVLVFRFFNVFGPLQPAGHAYAAVVPAFFSAILGEEPVRIFGDGTQTRDFTYVESVTRVLRAAVERNIGDDTPINLAFGSRTSLLELLACMEDVVGEPIQVVHEEPRPGDISHSQADSTKLRRLFPDLEAVSLRDGLAKTMEWFVRGSA